MAATTRALVLSGGGPGGGAWMLGLIQAVTLNLRGELPQSTTPVGMADWLTAAMRIIADPPDEQDAARRVASTPPLGPGIVSEAERRRVMAGHLPIQEWSAGRRAVGRSTVWPRRLAPGAGVSVT